MTSRRASPPRNTGASGRRTAGAPHEVRIIGGLWRRTRLPVADAPGLRPTPDRVRETLFNWLGQDLTGWRVLDAFAGSGALGIEALSRGAAEATFADTDAGARAVVAANVAHTGLEDRATVVGADGATALARGPWDLVLLDPPYAFDGWSTLLAGVAEGLSADGVAVLESDREIEVEGVLRGIRVRRYGGTVVTFATRPGAST